MIRAACQQLDTELVLPLYSAPIMELAVASDSFVLLDRHGHERKKGKKKKKKMTLTHH